MFKELLSNFIIKTNIIGIVVECNLDFAFIGNLITVIGNLGLQISFKGNFNLLYYSY